MTWALDQEEKLREEWEAGKSASQIAELLAPLAKPDKPITRNMVIGKAHRMGLPPRPSPIRKGGT